MSPFEAGMVDLEEPDWREVFDEEYARKPEEAYEATLKRWRRFHCTGTEAGKRIPAPAIDAIVALAHLAIMAPRSELRDIPRSWPGGYQADEHMWLSLSGEQWRITAIEDRMLLLEKMTFAGDKPETRQVDLNRADWTKHTAAAVAILEAMHERDCRTEAAEEGQAAAGGRARA